MSQIITKFITDLAVTNAKVATGIDAAKLADGSVSNAEFQYLANVTSDIQSQINAKLEGTDVAYFDTDHTFSPWWSANIPGLILDGTTTEALAAFGTSIVMKGNGNQAFLLISTEQQTAGANPSADINIFSGYVDGAATGSSGGAFLYSGNGVASSGNAQVFSGDATGGNSGQAVLKSGNATGTSGPVDISTGTGNPGSSGPINIKTGGAATGNSGDLTGETGDADASGFVKLKTGNANSLNSGYLLFETGSSTSADSGSISLFIGTAGGTQGQFQFYKSGVNPNIGDVWTATGTNGEGYWAAPSGGATGGKETFTLAAGDITNQYIDLAQVANTNSIHFIVKGGAPTLEGASHDYSVNYTGGAGGNTRITFLNDLATGGPAALIAGDVVQVVYTY